MKSTLKFSLIGLAIAIALVTAGCSGDSDSSGSGSSSSAVTSAGGGGSKGPFKQGSLVVAYKLVNGVRDVNVTTTTSDGRGHFDFGSTIPWTGPTEFVISGEYLNENTGTYMVLAPNKGLSAVTNITTGSTEVININILTNIAAPAIKAALVANTPITQAKADAQADVAEMFNIDLTSGAELTDLDLTEGGGDNAKANTQLLIISSALLNTDNPEQVMENLASGLEDGEADATSAVALQEIQSNVANVDLQVVAVAMEDADIGVTNAPDSDSALNGTLSFDNNISFVSEQDAFRNTVYTSSEATVVGMIGESGPISVTNGSYSIDGGAFVTTAGTIANGQKVRVRVTSSTSYATNVQTNLNIGGSDIAYNVTTKSDPFVADTTPNAFSFGFKAGQGLGANVTSDAVTITGINSPTNVTIDSGTFDVNASGTFVSTATITNGSTIRVNHTSDSTAGTEVKSTLTIGGVTGTFSSFTSPADTTPDVFTFVDVNDVNKTATPTVNSNSITIAGINTATPISVVGGEMNVAGAGFTSTATTISSGDSLVLKAVPSDSFETTTTVTVTVGNVVANFSVTTMSDPFVADTTPNAFSFSSKLNQAVNTPVDANITVSGINVPTSISIVNGSYSVNGGGQDNNVSNGDVIVITNTSSASFDTENITTLTIGGVSATFKTRTLLEDSTPNTFNFDENMSVTTGTLVTSNTVTITGITAGTNLPISITNGEYEINGGGYTSVAGTVSLNDTVTIQQTSALAQGTAKVSTLTVGSTIRSFTTKTQVNAPSISGTADATVAEDSEYVFSPTIDTNSGEITTWSIQNKPSWATFNDINGLLSGIPQNADVATTSDINITATNAQGSSSVIIASLEVTNTNDAPDANNTTVSTNEDTAVDINTTALISDVDVGDSYTLSFTQGSHGSVTNSNGVLTYTPTANTFGSDSFTFTANDGEASDTATVTVTVNPVNDLMDWNPPASNTQNEDFTAFNVDIAGSDVDGPIVYQVTSVNTIFTTSLNGSILTVSPVANANGSEMLTLQATQGVETRVHDINVTINAVDDVTVWNTPATLPAVDEDFTEFTVDLNATDVDGNVTYALVSTTGVVTADVTGSTLTITAVENVSGNETLVVSATQGGVTTNHSISFTVNAINDDTVWNTPATLSAVDEDFAEFTVDLNATDVDGNVTYALVSNPAGIVTTSLTGSVLTITPIADANGDSNITVSATQGGVTLNHTMALSVNAINDAPVSQNASLNVVMSHPASGTLVASDVDEGDSLTFSIVDQADVNGTVVIDDNSTGAYTYTPVDNFEGNVSFTFKATDISDANSNISTITMTVADRIINVTAVNDSGNVDEDQNVTIDVLANDTKVFDDGNGGTPPSFTVSAVSNPANGTATIVGTSIQYTPNHDFYGTDSFVYTANTSGYEDNATVNITVTPVNDTPVITTSGNITVAEDSNITIVDINITDVDGTLDPANVSMFSSDDTTAEVVDGNATTVSILAKPNQFGAVNITLRAVDGNETTEKTFMFTITPVNDAPTANDDAFNAVMNTTSTNWDILDNDNDIDSNLTISDCNTTTSQDGNVTFDSTEILTYNPATDFTGVDTFSCTITDGEFFDTSLITITVSGNHAPTTTSGGSITMTMGETITGMIMANGNDENETLTYTATTVTPNLSNQGTTLDSTTGEYSIHAGEIGQGQIVVTITDNGTPNLSTTATYNINVIASQAQIDPFTYSDSNVSMTSSEFNSASGLAIPADEKLYSFWGTNDGNVSSLQIEFLEFDSNGTLVMPDGIGSHNGTYHDENNSITRDPNNMISASQSASYDEAKKVADIKLLETYNGSEIINNIPGLRHLHRMATSAKAYKSAVRMAQDRYYIDSQAQDCNQNSCTPYVNLESMIDNEAHGTIEYNRDNQKRKLVFGNDANLSSESGSVVEIDYTDPDNIIVTNATTVTWSIGNYVDDDDNNNTMVMVHLNGLSGYGDRDIALVQAGAMIHGSETTTVFKGDYEPAGSVFVEYRFNDTARAIIQNSITPVTPPDYMNHLYQEDINATQFDALTATIDPTNSGSVYELEINFDENGTAIYELTELNFGDNNVFTMTTTINGVMEEDSPETANYAVDGSNVVTITQSGTDVYKMKFLAPLDDNNITAQTGLSLPATGTVAYQVAGLNLVDDTWYDGDAQAFDTNGTTYTYNNIAAMVSDVQPQNAKAFEMRQDGNETYVLTFATDSNATNVGSGGDLVEVRLSDMNATAGGTWEVISANGEDTLVIHPETNSSYEQNMAFAMDGQATLQKGGIDRANTGMIGIKAKPLLSEIIQANFINLTSLLEFTYEEVAGQTVYGVFEDGSENFVVTYAPSGTNERYITMSSFDQNNPDTETFSIENGNIILGDGAVITRTSHVGNTCTITYTPSGSAPIPISTFLNRDDAQNFYNSFP